MIRFYRPRYSLYVKLPPSKRMFRVLDNHIRREWWTPLSDGRIGSLVVRYTKGRMLVKADRHWWFRGT